MKINSSLTIGAILFLALATGSISLAAESPKQRLAAYSEKLREKFPEVAFITVDDLAAQDPKPVLLDVRSEKEFAVSHLPGAVRVETVDDVHELGVQPDVPIAVYCSIGYRSAVLARKLGQAGFADVRNVEGSIFAWAHQGYPLVNTNGKTTGVHPFNLWWGRYLDRSRWQWKEK